MLSEFYDIGNTAPVLCFKRAPGNGSWVLLTVKKNGTNNQCKHRH
jgi:hypothetical protein